MAERIIYPGSSWSDTVDDVLFQKKIRVHFEKSADDLFYIDVSDEIDRQDYKGFYLTREQLQEIVETIT